MEVGKGWGGGGSSVAEGGGREQEDEGRDGQGCWHCIYQGKLKMWISIKGGGSGAGARGLRREAGRQTGRQAQGCW